MPATTDTAETAATDPGTMFSLDERLDIVETYVEPSTVVSSRRTGNAQNNSYSNNNSATRDSLLARIRTLHQQVARVESRCPGLQSAADKCHAMSDHLGVALVDTTVRQQEHKQSWSKLGVSDQVKTALLLEAQTDVEQCVNLLDQVDVLKGAVNLPFLADIDEATGRLDKAEAVMVSSLVQASELRKQVRSQLAEYASLMDAMSHQVVVWDELIANLEEEKRAKNE